LNQAVDVKKSILVVTLVVFCVRFMLADSTSGLIIHAADHQVLITEAHPVLDTDQEITSFTIPLKRAGNLMLVDALVDGLPGNLIFDTGSSRIVLNAIYFRQGRKVNNQVSAGVTGVSGPISQTGIDKILISEIEYRKLMADVTDLGHIEKARNTKVLGLFGFSLFAEYEIVLDLQKSQVVLHKIDYNGNRKMQEATVNFDLEIPITQVSGIVFIEARMANKRCTFCIDTGAETNVLSNKLPTKILNSLTVLRRTKLRGAGSQSTEALFCLMNDFSIGKHRFSDMNALVTNLSHMTYAYGFFIDGMLGNDFLEKGVFCFNLTKNKLGVNFVVSSHEE